MVKCHIGQLGLVRNKLTKGTNPVVFPGYSEIHTQNPGTFRGHLKPTRYMPNLVPQKKRKPSNDSSDNFGRGNEKTTNNSSHICTLKAFKYDAGEVKLRGCIRGQSTCLGLALWQRLVQGEWWEALSTGQWAHTFISTIGHQTASALVSVCIWFHSTRT